MSKKNKSNIWETEDDERQKYISEQFKKAFIIKKNISKKEYEELLNDLLDVTDSDLDMYGELQQDMIRYLQGEINTEKIIKETFDIIKKKESKEKADKIKDEFEFKRQEKGKNYRISKQYSYGYVKGKKQKARVEQYLEKGKLKIRYRDNKGRFASLIRK